MSKRIGLMVAFTASVALGGPASADPSPHTQLDAARIAWVECVRAAISQLDHPPAVSTDVARAAMSRCSNQYADMTRALSRTLAPRCGNNADCTRAALEKASREAAKTAVGEVTAARIRTAGAQAVECQ